MARFTELHERLKNKTCPHCDLPITGVDVEQEAIPVHTMGGMVKDLGWRFVDRAGHVHRYDNKLKMRYDFLNEVAYCFDCREDHEYWIERCIHCSEEITPGTKYEGPRTEYIPGIQTITLRPCGHEVGSLPT